MLARQFLTLALSALIGFTPINFGWDGTEIEFPFTRTNEIRWRISWDIDDLGAIAIGSSMHDYVINYQADIYCSSACSVVQAPNYGYNLTDTHIVWYWYARVNNQTPDQLLQSLTGFNATGMQRGQSTYRSADDYANTTLGLEYPNNGMVNLVISIPALTEGTVVAGIHYVLDDFKLDYELVNKKRLIYQLVLDKDMDSEYQQRVLNLLRQNDIDAAYNLVENYYYDNAVSQTVNNENIVNNYYTTQTDLNTIYNQEHQFTVGIENQFENQIQLLDPTNSVIDNVSWQQSAVWVTDKFNRFTNGNAFGSLLGFSLLIGFAMAIIGRVLK